jgi:translation initiation factor 4A
MSDNIDREELKVQKAPKSGSKTRSDNGRTGSGDRPKGRDNNGRRGGDGNRGRNDGNRGRNDRNERNDRNDRSGRNDRPRRGGRGGGGGPGREKKPDEPSVDIVENNKGFDLPDSIDDFEDMKFLNEDLLTAIYDYGFKFPSTVQSRSIHIIHSGHDMIVQSDSGTGKTGAFTIGMLSIIEPEKRQPQAIIVANTHPLANQIEIVVSRLAEKMGVSVCLCVGSGKGGGGMRPDQNAKVAKRSHILVGTPGRLKDIARKGVFKPQDIKILVMDEADELLKRDFRDDIQDIVGQVSEDTQICTFSATYTESSYDLARNGMMKSPYEIVIQQEQLSTDRIQQYKVTLVPDDYGNFRQKRRELEWQKFGVLMDVANGLSVNQAIIFTNQISTAYRVRDQLMNNGFDATDVITSDTDPVDREKILRQFRLCQIKFLISTDLISRGIDIDDLRCVINFDFPKTSESYIHRIGRSGRFGGHGVAINLMTYDDRYLLTQLRSDYRVEIDDMPAVDDINAILNHFGPPTDKALSSQNYV